MCPCSIPVCFGIAQRVTATGKACNLKIHDETKQWLYRRPWGSWIDNPLVPLKPGISLKMRHCTVHVAPVKELSACINDSVVNKYQNHEAKYFISVLKHRPRPNTSSSTNITQAT